MSRKNSLTIEIQYGVFQFVFPVPEGHDSEEFKKKMLAIIEDPHSVPPDVAELLMEDVRRAQARTPSGGVLASP